MKMTPLNDLLNYVEYRSNTRFLITQQVSSRIITVIIGFPLEITAILQNVIKLTFLVGQSIIKIPTKVVSVWVESETLKEFDSSLCLLELLTTICKVIKYIFGSIFTATVGILSPSFNFRLHILMGLVTDVKKEKAYLEIQEKAYRVQEAQEKAMQIHYQNVLLAMQYKIGEKERHLVEKQDKNDPRFFS
jgi:hypothetical protein